MPEAPLRKRDRELTDEEIEEMLRPGAEVRDWALENPEPQLEESPSVYSGDLGQRMLTPETRHEAGKDYLKAAATEVAGNAALGGAGKVAQAAIAFIPAPKEFARHGISKISAAIPEAAKQKFLAALDELKANNPFAYDNQIEKYQKVIARAEREEARKKLVEQAKEITTEDILMDVISELKTTDPDRILPAYQKRYRNLRAAQAQEAIKREGGFQHWPGVSHHEPRRLVDLKRHAEHPTKHGGPYDLGSSPDLAPSPSPPLPRLKAERIMSPFALDVRLRELRGKNNILTSNDIGYYPWMHPEIGAVHPGSLTRNSEAFQTKYYAPEELFIDHLYSIDPTGRYRDRFVPIASSSTSTWPLKGKVLGEDIYQIPIAGPNRASPVGQGVHKRPGARIIERYNDPAPPGSLSMPEGYPGALSMPEGSPGALSIAEGTPGREPEGFPMSNLDAFKKALGGQ
jgi:hypothetical protein